ERGEDASAHGFFPCLAGELLDEVARRQKHQVVVLPLLAKPRVGRKVLQALDELTAGEGLVVVPDQVVARQAGAVRDEIARGDLLRRRWVREAKAGEVARQRPVPVELSLVDELSEDEGGEGLGTGADGEERVGGRGE